jgi:hypothetical protein
MESEPEIFMAGSEETRESWHGGSLAKELGEDLPIGSSGRRLSRGLWTADVPLGDEQCRLFLELRDTFPSDALTPYVRVHPLSCEPASKASVRGQGGGGHSKDRITGASHDLRGSRAANKSSSNASKDYRRSIRRDAAATSDALKQPNISGTVSTLVTSPSLYDFSVDGAIIASYFAVNISETAGFQFWLIQPVQARLLGEAQSMIILEARRYSMAQQVRPRL